ncbi:hypothetical protein VHEMI10475 [[Torrubiella] hemipterigena]|uniref:Uncharacterized protein n=1 Tax=[Torrubiella] hemipterigena TaxID=1531966 RepID=A0A0A1TD42_9HYPO|nr:hypothetical protein VHEMI10475 [[Torrubiella] hemipterigena]
MSANTEQPPWMSANDVASREKYRAYCAYRGHTLDDLIEMGLEQGKDMDILLQRHLLGQPNELDRDHFVATLDGYTYFGEFMWYWNLPLTFPPRGLQSPSICKFIICDGRVPDMDTFDGDGNAAIDRLYQEQVRLEATNDRIERARAAIRSREQIAASQLARAMLTHYNKQVEEQGSYNIMEAWKLIEPKRPVWIKEIYEGSREKYGFVVFESSKLRNRPLQAIVQWYRTFNGQNCVDEGFLTGYPHARYTVMDGGKLRFRWTMRWEKEPVDEDDPESMKKRFMDLVPSLPKKMSKTTFLVVTDDCIFPELETNQLWLTKLLRWPNDRQEGKIAYQDLPPFYIWAYDAAWTPPTGKAAKEPFDGYEGRIRVDSTVLLSWFYYARTWTDLTMRQLWEKADRSPHQVWHVQENLANRAEPEALV